MTTTNELETGDRLPEALATLLPPAGPGVRARIVYFMRAIDCAICRSHVRRLVALGPTLHEAGVDVTVFAPAAGAEPAARWIESQPFPVRLTQDAHASAGLGHALFGRVQQSGTFLVGADGRLLIVRRATLPFQAFDEHELLDTLRAVGLSARAA